MGKFHCQVGSAALILLLSIDCWAQEPLCGIHSLYTAGLVLGVDPAFGDLLKPEFVGSDRGSSLAELENAAAKLGMQSLSVKNLTAGDLRHSRLPIILHVKTDLASSN